MRGYAAALLCLLLGSTSVAAVASTTPAAAADAQAHAVEAAQVRHYDWLTMGEVSGSQLLRVHADGRRTSEFRFNDRGRGPELREELLTDAASGVLLRQDLMGHAYMGAAVAERFERGADGTARWHSAAEQGQQAHASSAWYVSAESTPETLAALARALLLAPGNALALLPAGHARIQEVARETVSNGAAQREVTLYAISGLGFEPGYVWLDQQRELFALAYGWMGLVPRGWTQALAPLQERQDALEREYHHRLAQRVTHALPEQWCLHDVRVLDVDAGRLLEGSSVRVSEGNIVAVGRSDALACEGLHSIDGEGAVAMPGLWDMHVHASPGDGLLHVAAGVLAVRDMANEHEQVLRIASDFESGAVVGPRLHRTGFIDQESPFAAPTGKLAGSLEEAVQFVHWYADRGYPQIKIYSSIDPQWVPEIARAVHARGMRLSGHVPSGMTAAEAVRAGFDEIQHVNMLLLNFLAGPEDDTRTPLRFTLVGEKAGALDLRSAPVRDFVALLKSRDTIVDPTLAIFDSMFRQRGNDIDPSFAMIAGHMPPNVRRGFHSGALQGAEQHADAYLAAAERQLQLVALLHREGIRLVPGTDSLAGFGLHRELELYAQAGIPVADILRLATIGAARIAGADHALGRIAPGMRAELVLLRDDPLQDINAVRRVLLSIRSDRFYRPEELYREIGVAPFVPSLSAGAHD